MSDFTRRLPVYILLDCSGSMMGDPIEAVRQGLKALVSEVRSDPQSLETAHLSVITFDSDARQVVPLTEVMQFQEPDLHASGATAMGKALRVLMECMKTEVRKSSEEQKGDWRPMVYVLTDGCPTDSGTFDSAARELREAKTANVVACAAGSEARTDTLKQFTDNVLMLNTLTAGDLGRFFKWVSSSIVASSKSVNADPGKPFELPPPPQGFVMVP